MLGAEVNAALMKYQVRRIIKRTINGKTIKESSEPDQAVDI
jgi:hypothetical protein